MPPLAMAILVSFCNLMFVFISALSNNSFFFFQKGETFVGIAHAIQQAIASTTQSTSMTSVDWMSLIANQLTTVGGGTSGSSQHI